jgi:hypothetical protein
VRRSGLLQAPLILVIHRTTHDASQMNSDCIPWVCSHYRASRRSLSIVRIVGVTCSGSIECTPRRAAGASCRRSYCRDQRHHRCWYLMPAEPRGSRADSARGCCNLCR